MMAGKKKTPLMCIPPSLKMVDLATRHGYTPKTEEQKRAVRDRIKLEGVSASLNVPAPNSGSALRHDTEIDDSWASLPVFAINFYERNPRKANNEAYAELKESIRVNGILQPLTVTKRPGETHYILYAGGNTRLQAIRELWEETAEPKFRETRVIIKTWRGEASVLLAHMAENTQRNDMTFWDRANGILEIKRQMEEEGGKTLSHREFEAEIKKFGIQTDLRTLSMYRFAVEKLPDVGRWLSGLSVRDIQPRLNLLLKLANHHDIEEAVFYDEVVTPTAKAVSLRIQEGGAVFSSGQFIADCDATLAQRLELDGRTMAKMLTAMERFPEMTLEDLRRVCKSSPSRPAQELSAQTSIPAKATRDPGQRSARPEPEPDEADADASAAPRHPSVLREAIQYAPERPQSDLIAAPRAEVADQLLGLGSLIQAILVASSLGSCYEPAPGMPHGYYMGFPKDGPLDLKEDAQSRQAAWWVLAMTSGQFDRSTCRAGLDESNEWRTLILEESNHETLGGLELAIQHNIGGQGEFLPIPWLMNPGNPIAGACLRLLAAVRGGL